MSNSTMQPVISAMTEVNAGDPARINHVLKVYTFAKTIGESEKLSPDEQEILELAAILHDIGIHESERRYGMPDGVHQQIEGPPIARRILEPLSYPEPVIDRVCYLIAHHHTYTNVDGLDYRILLESDFLVNCDEDPSMKQSLKYIYDHHFETEEGKRLFTCLFFNHYDPNVRQ